MGERWERAPWGGSAQGSEGEEQPGAGRAESTLCSYAEENQSLGLESCFPWLLPVKRDPAHLLCSLHAPSLRQGSSQGNTPLAHRPGTENTRVKAARLEGLSHSVWTQKPISRCFSAEVFPQHCQAQSRYSAFLSALPSRTAPSAQAECSPFPWASKPADENQSGTGQCLPEALLLPMLQQLHTPPSPSGTRNLPLISIP